MIPLKRYFENQSVLLPKLFRCVAWHHFSKFSQLLQHCWDWRQQVSEFKEGLRQRIYGRFLSEYKLENQDHLDIPDQCQPGKQKLEFSTVLCLAVTFRPLADWMMSGYTGRINAGFTQSTTSILITSGNSLTDTPPKIMRIRWMDSLHPSLCWQYKPTQNLSRPTAPIHIS